MKQQGGKHGSGGSHSHAHYTVSARLSLAYTLGTTSHTLVYGVHFELRACCDNFVAQHLRSCIALQEQSSKMHFSKLRSQSRRAKVSAWLTLAPDWTLSCTGYKWQTIVGTEQSELRVARRGTAGVKKTNSSDDKDIFTTRSSTIFYSGLSRQQHVQQQNLDNKRNSQLLIDPPIAAMYSVGAK